MNKVILMGRLTKDPDIRYTPSSDGQGQTAVARYTLAVDRKFAKKDADQTADFITCVAFGKNGEFAEKYLHQGTKIVVCGRIQTGNYTNKDGQKVYTTDVVVEEHDFAESKASANGGNAAASTNTNGSYTPSRPEPTSSAGDGGFMNIPDGIEDEGLPFN